MPEWQYRKMTLSEHPRRFDEVDLLCDAGEHGWELVLITTHNVAYFKRALDERPARSGHSERSDHQAPDVKPKYRNPATGETWSGRGRMASWLKQRQDAGEDIERYRIKVP